MTQTLVIEIDENATSVVNAVLVDDAGLSYVPVQDLPALAYDGAVVVVLDGRVVAVHTIDLPAVDDTKARKILPTVLDDKIASFDTPIHMALIGDRNPETGKRVVAVVGQHVMANVMALMDTLAIKADVVVPDFMLLEPMEETPVTLSHRDVCLVRLPDGDGYCLDQLSADAILGDQTVRPLSAGEWDTCLKRAASTDINLLQGSFAPRNSLRLSLVWWRRSAVLAGLIIAVLMMTTWYGAQENFRKADAYYQGAERLFRQALPEETRIINMEVQLRRALASRGQQGGGEFFVLSSHVLRATQAGEQALLETLRYNKENGEFVLDVSFATFAESAEFKRELEQNGMKVTEGSSRQEAGRVYSEIRLRRP